VENRYLVSLPIPDSRVGGVERCFVLSSLGRDIAGALGLPVDGYFRPGKTRIVSFTHLTHEMLVNRCRIAAVCFSRAQPAFSLVETRLGAEVAALTPPLPAIPDCWMLWVGKDGKKFPLWIEIDNATEYYKRFLQLLQARVECLTSGAYTRAFPEAEGAVVIAYVVAGRTRQAAITRREQLCRWTMRILSELAMERWAGMFRYAEVVFSEVYTQGLYHESLWYPPNSRTPVPLFGP
jgi:hypothetical protein